MSAEFKVAIAAARHDTTVLTVIYAAVYTWNLLGQN